VLQGNVNTYIAELREVDPPIIARSVRFVPYSVHPKPACMRVELYGCTWTGKNILLLYIHLYAPHYHYYYYILFSRTTRIIIIIINRFV